MPHRRLIVAFLLVMFAIVLVVEPLPVHAASSLVQQNAGGCDPCSGGFQNEWPISVTFTDNVVSGNVVVVGAEGYPQTVTSISDSLLSSYSLAETTSTPVSSNLYIYYATLTASGADTVTVTFSAGSTPSAYVFIYEVSGVTTTGVGTASGSGVNDPVHATTSASVAFQPGAFLLGVIWIGLTPTPTVTAGQGFTLSSHVGATWAQAEYSTGGVSSPTNFPASFDPSGGSTYWGEVGIALNPPIAPSGPVGGFIEPVNKLVVLAPYLALFGVMAVVVVAVVPWKKREN